MRNISVDLTLLVIVYSVSLVSFLVGIAVGGKLIVEGTPILF